MPPAFLPQWMHRRKKHLEMSIKSKAVIVVAAMLAADLFAARETVVWEGNRTVDGIVKILAKDLIVKSGATVRFSGEGRIDLREGTLTATNATFVAEGVITNAWRISVVSGGLRLDGCRLRGMKAVEPVKGYGYYIGSVMVQGYPVRIAECEAEDSSAIAVVNAKDAEICRNVFSRCYAGLFAFHTAAGRVRDNAFFDCSEALRVNAAHETEFSGNRFTDCGKAIHVLSNRKCRFTGNSFFGGATGVMLWCEGGGNLYSANLFEDVRGAAFAAFSAMGADNTFANNIVSRCGYGWNLGRQNPERRIVLRDNVIMATATGIALAEGEVYAPNNAFWKVNIPISAKDEAKVSVPKMVAADPLFVDAARGDYRLKPDSPLRQAGVNGGDIGLYQ